MWGIDEQDKLALFLVEWSKTIQHCKCEMWVPVMPAVDPQVCLITVLKKYFKLVPARGNDPCFCYHNKSGELKALTYGQLNEQLKTWVKATGKEGKDYTTHCLRRGGTSHAFESGIKTDYIKLMGDWASQCYFRYIDVTMDHRIRAAVRFSKNFN